MKLTLIVLRNTLLILPMIFFYSCDSASNISYFPLKNGMKKKFNSSYGEFSSEVRESRVIGKFKCSQIAYIYPKSTDFVYYADTDSGVFKIAEESNNTEMKVFEFPKLEIIKPFEVGKSWEFEEKIEGNRYNITARITNVSETVSIRTGTYENCLHINYTAERNIDFGVLFGQGKLILEIDKWYAKGVGLIKMNRKITSNHMMAGLGENPSFELIELIK